MHARPFALPRVMSVWAAASSQFNGMATVMLLLFVFGSALSTGARAALYKCVDENGHTTFTGARCPSSGGQVEAVVTPSRRAAPVDCRIAGNFASQAARVMKRGLPSSSFFDRHGGIDSMSPATIGIVSYIYEFKHNNRASASRVTALAVNRCQAGAFGNVSCDAFPSRFIAELGGCKGAKIPGGSYGRESFGRPAAAREADSRDERGTRQNAPTAPNPDLTRLRTRSDRSADSDRQRCRARIALAIDNVNAQMRTARSTRSHDQLNEKRRSLSKQLGAC